MKPMLRALSALALLLAGACLAPAPAPVPLSPDPSDPVGSAAAALRAECRRLARDRATQCYEAGLLEMVVAPGGVGRAMAVLGRLDATDPELRRDGHLYAHSVGLAALRDPGAVTETFEQCSPLFQSGCYHGVIQSYFASLPAGGVGAAEVNALCAAWRGDAAKRWLLFQCAHGMGHGLAQVNAHHLPRTLAGCDLVTDPWEREGCYGGAFMENVVQATVPHHTVGRPPTGDAAPADPHAGHAMPAQAMPAPDMSAHAGHDMAAHAAAAPAEPFPPLKRDDPLYPCNALATRYQLSCWGMQTSAILFFNGGDFAATARACDRAPDAYRTACYQSLGRDISAYTLQDHAAAMRACSNGDPAYRAWCHVGYTKNLIDLTASPDDALAYCAALPDAGGKGACYEAVGEELWVLMPDPETRRRTCERAEPAHREPCAAAAGVRRG